MGCTAFASTPAVLALDRLPEGDRPMLGGDLGPIATDEVEIVDRRSGEAVSRVMAVVGGVRGRGDDHGHLGRVGADRPRYRVDRLSRGQGRIAGIAEPFRTVEGRSGGIRGIAARRMACASGSTDARRRSDPDRKIGMPG